MTTKNNNIMLKSLLFIVLLFVPFVFANYFIIDYYFKNGEYFFVYDSIILTALKIVSVIAVGLFIRLKNGYNNETTNSKIKYGIWGAFAVMLILFITGIYPDLYNTITMSLGIMDNAPLFIKVIWEQLLDGTFFLAILLCMSIGFIPKKSIKE